MLLAAVTGILIIIGRSQINSVRREAKLQRTLDICERWDTDPVIDQCLRRLSQADRSGDIQKNPQVYRIDAITILNFLESICNWN